MERFTLQRGKEGVWIGEGTLTVHLWEERWR